MRDHSSETSVSSTRLQDHNPEMSEHIYDSCHVYTVHSEVENTSVNDVHRRKTKDFEFCRHGSVHRESNLITVQQDATYAVYYISVGSSTCFGC